MAFPSLSDVAFWSNRDFHRVQCNLIISSRAASSCIVNPVAPSQRISLAASAWLVHRVLDGLSMLEKFVTWTLHITTIGSHEPTRQTYAAMRQEVGHG